MDSSIPDDCLQMTVVVQLTGTSGTVGGGGRMKHLKPNLNLVLSD